MTETQTEPKLSVAILPVTPFQQNCTLIWNTDTKAGAVIDPGGDVEAIKSAIEETGISVETIFLTHGHIDHAGGAAALREALGVPVVGPHEDDRFLLEGLAEQGRMFGVGLDDARPITPDRWLAEGEDVTIGGETFAVLHCPGHAPGHVVFVNHAARFIVMGDVLFNGSIGRTDFPYGDHEALITAIKTKILPLGDDYTFVCGHGPGSTIGDERRNNPFLT